MKTRTIFSRIFDNQEVLLFSAVLVLMFLRLSGLFRNAELPGWDTPSHFFALSKMTEYLSQGHISGYLPEWLGGMPLFQFYAPLFFIAVGGFWLLTFKLIPLALLFRIAIFLAIFSTSLSFWYFLKTFFNRRIARWGILLSLVFIFYPKIYSVFGIGAGAAIWIGLIAGTIGLSLALLWLSFLENLRKNPDSPGRFTLTTFGVAALVLAHTLSFIGGFICFVMYLLYHIRDRKIVLRGVIAFLLGLALAAFWLGPFAANLRLSSGDIRGIGTLALNPIYFLFPFKMPYLNLSAVVMLGLFLAGVYLLFKDKKYFPLLLLGGMSLFFIARNQLSLIFSELIIHYPRFLPFIFIFVLSPVAYALDWLWRCWTQDLTRRKVYFVILVVFLALNFFYAFDIKSEISPGDPFIRQPLAWQWSEFESAAEGQALLDKLKNINDAVRILVQMPPIEAEAYLGSLHYFTSQVPLRNNQNVITGLYVESGALAPFIMPTLEALTLGEAQAYGDVRLQLVKPFYNQDIGLHLQRLKKFGVNYLVSYSLGFTRRLVETNQVVFSDRTEYFKIFKLPDAYPLAYKAKYQPALYLNFGNKSLFREVAMALFAGSETFDFPIAEGKLKIAALNHDWLDSFSVMIVNGSGLCASDFEALLKLKHPLVILNAGGEIKNAIAAAVLNAGDIHFVDNFEIIAKRRNLPYEQWPAGWSDLIGIISSYQDRYRISDADVVTLKQFSDQQIVFEGSGPIIVNSGYSPYWQQSNCASCQVFRVSPDQMLVFGNGEVELEYAADSVKKASILLSLLTVAGLIIFNLHFVFKKKK